MSRVFPAFGEQETRIPEFVPEEPVQERPFVRSMDERRVRNRLEQPKVRRLGRVPPCDEPVDDLRRRFCGQHQLRPTRRGTHRSVLVD